MSANEERAVMVGGMWLLARILTLIAAFSGRIFMAQVKLHLLLSGAPFLQVLIHQVVKRNGSLWKNKTDKKLMSHKFCSSSLQKSTVFKK